MWIHRSRWQALEKELKQVIPQGTEIRRAETRSGQIEKMVSAFHLNLTALSLISLIVGMFLIYHAISTSVIQRRREIGILRGLGVTRSQVLTLFVGEAGLIGVLGALLGIGAGIILAKAMLYFVSRTITALYILVKAENLSIPPLVLIEGFGLGVLVSAFASLGPAREASRIAPREALAMGTLESKAKIRIKLFSLIGLGLLVVALLSALQKPIANQPLFGFLAALLIVIGVSFLVPLICLFPQPSSLSPSPFPFRCRREIGKPLYPRLDGQDRDHHRGPDDSPLHAYQHLHYDPEFPKDGRSLGGTEHQR